MTLKPFHYLPMTVLALAIATSAGCSSSDDDNDTSGSTTGETDGTGADSGSDPGSDDTPVTGEFHNIQPGDVEAYVARYEAMREAVLLTVDSTEHELTFLGEGTDDNVFIAGYEDGGNEHLLLIGFDFEAEEPIPFLQIQQLENDEAVSVFTGEDDSIEVSESGENLVFTGTLTQNLPAGSDASSQVRLVFNESLPSGGTTEIEVAGTDAILSGDLGTGSYLAMRDMISNNPAVTRLVLQQSTGSVNDDINVHTGRLIRNASLATHVPADGDINSGAVDLFAAGTTRTVEDGGKLGVHSWCCTDAGQTADQLTRGDEAHGVQLTYFREMLGEENGVEFYFFTLEAAPFDSIEVMTRDELEQFLLTP